MLKKIKNLLIKIFAARCEYCRNIIGNGYYAGTLKYNLFIGEYWVCEVCENNYNKI